MHRRGYEECRPCAGRLRLEAGKTPASEIHSSSWCGVAWPRPEIVTISHDRAERVVASFIARPGHEPIVTIFSPWPGHTAPARRMDLRHRTLPGLRRRSRPAQGRHSSYPRRLGERLARQSSPPFRSHQLQLRGAELADVG